MLFLEEKNAIKSTLIEGQAFTNKETYITPLALVSQLSVLFR